MDFSYFKLWLFLLSIHVGLLSVVDEKLSLSRRLSYKPQPSRFKVWPASSDCEILMCLPSLLPGGPFCAVVPSEASVCAPSSNYLSTCTNDVPMMTSRYERSL